MASLSIEARRLLLASTSILKALGHSGFERMLLELGVPEDVGSGSGLLSRSTSLARYVLSNPDAKDFRGELLSQALIKRATNLSERGVTANLTQDEIDEFDDALAAAIDAKLEINAQLEGTNTRPSIQPLDLPIPLETRQPRPERPKARRKVFVVHGHDEGPREKVARLLEHLNFEPVILHERPNRGRTIITKFQQEAADVGFAVVLITPDDTGGRVGHQARPRPRQNVVFELGFFVGVLGAERVAAIVKGDVEKPSDFDGVMYITMDDSDGWRSTLARELQAAGFEVDFANLVRGNQHDASQAAEDLPQHPFLEVGQEVHHAKFGFGMVVEIDGKKVDVDFVQVGRKRVLDEFLNLD